MVSNEVIFKSGLAIVPIDPKKLGFIRQYTSGFVNHRPFTILFKVKEDLRNDELYCHVVEESGKSMIAIRPYEVKGIADEETYVTDHSSIKIESTSFCSSHRKGLGAPIAITVKDEAVAVGAITLSNNKQLSFVLFSQIDRKRAFSDEGNGGGGEQQAPGEPAEGEEQQPPREPAGREEQQAPGEPAGGEEQQAPREPAGGEEQQAPREPAGGEEQQAPREPAGGEEQQAPREPAGGEEQQAPGEPAGGEEQQAPREPAGGEEQQAPGEPAGGEEQQAPGEPAGGKEQQAPGEPAGGEKQQAPGEPAGGEEQQALGEPAGGEEQQAPGEQDGQNLNIGVGVAHMAPSDPSAYSKTERDVLSKIAWNYLAYTPPRNREEHNEFKEYLKEVGTLITGLKFRSLVITVKCDSLKSLEELWKEYSSGLLGKMVQDCFVTEKILKELNLAELKLKTTMDLEEYNAYKLYFLKKDALKGASSSEFHSISSTSESPQNQEELKKWEQKTNIVETEKRKEELEELRMKLQIMKDLEEKLGRVCVDLKMLRTEGSFPVLKVSIVDLEEKLTELRKKLRRSRMEALLSGCFPVLQFSTVDLEKKLDELCMEFQRLRMEGTLPPPELSTTDPGDDFERQFIEVNRVLMKDTDEIPEVNRVLMKGFSSPPLLSTTDLEEKLGRVCVDLKMLRMEGSFPVLKFSTIDLEEKLTELHMKLQRSRMEGTFLSPALLTANLEEKLIELLTELERQRDKGSLPPAFSTVEVEVDELLKKFQKWRIEEFHSTSSTSESPQKKEQWEKSEQQTKIMETAKLEGTSPLIVVPTSGHGKELEESWGRKGTWPLPGSSTFDLEEKLEELRMKLQIMEGSLHSLPTTDLKEKLKQVFEEISKLRMRGSFSALKFSTIGLEKKLAELRMELERLRMEGTLPPPELFTADLEDEQEQLEQLIWILIRRKRVKGSLRSLFLTIETVSSLRRELEKVKMAAILNAMYPTIRSGLAKFDVSLPEEVQNYVSYLLDVSAKLHLRKQVLQPPRALEELREAMDKDELKTFLTIHIRDGAWQVVLLFTDELPKVKLPWDRCGKIHNEDEDEDEDEEVSNEVIYSSKSGILNGWPTHYDPGLVTLCKAITNKDWKVTRLILSLSRIPDEGLKNLSTALTQSELYSLTLYDIGLQSQGLEHLCNALTSVNCRLTNLNVRGNELGDVGIMHLCNALTSVDCTLTSLNVRCNNLGDVGIRHLCNALTSVNCRLTNLNVSLNKLGDVGIMHLCNALTSVDCTLTSLNVSNSELGDVGIRHLLKALNSVNCRLTSLNVSANQFGDNGLKHLCDALTSRNCALTKLKVRLNRLGDRGIKELSEVLTSGFCTLTSLDVSCNKFGDVGIKHLCKALTDTKCKLRSLNLCSNRYVTKDGKKYLSQMLTGTDWEDKGALRLSRSTTE